MPDKFAKWYVLARQLRVVEISPFLLLIFKLNYMYKLESNSINGVELNDEIFQEELVEWTIIHRESFIDELYRWIAEALQGNRSDAQLMKDDQQMLIKETDEYIFSSVSTNDYVCSDDERFNEICEKLLSLNETLK